MTGRGRGYIAAIALVIITSIILGALDDVRFWPGFVASMAILTGYDLGRRDGIRHAHNVLDRYRRQP
jgi:hypothetical protein